MSDFPHHGVHPELEEEANRLIRESLIGVTARSAKSDILTPWKEMDRRSREIYNSTGVAEPTTRLGIFHRAWNATRPDLNSFDGIARGGRERVDSAYESALSMPGGGLCIESSDGTPVELHFGREA